MRYLTYQERKEFKQYFDNYFLIFKFKSETPRRKHDGCLSNWVERYEIIKKATNSYQFLTLDGRYTDLIKALEEELVEIKNIDPYFEGEEITLRLMKNIKLRKEIHNEMKKKKQITDNDTTDLNIF
jgi:hypothetical protein